MIVGTVLLVLGAMFGLNWLRLRIGDETGVRWKPERWHPVVKRSTGWLAIACLAAGSLVVVVNAGWS